MHIPEFESGLIVSVLNALQIQLFKTINAIMAPYLAREENHRTENEFADSLISKLVVLDFVNTFSSFLVIAFVAMNLPNREAEKNGHLGECGAVTCMEPLTSNLIVIFIIMTVIGN